MVELSKKESAFLYKMMIDYERIISLLYKMMIDYERIISLSQNPYYGMTKSDLIVLKNKLFNGGLNNAN